MLASSFPPPRTNTHNFTSTRNDVFQLTTTPITIPPKTITKVVHDHTWKGKHAHIIRRQGVVRCKIQDIILKPHHVGIIVHFVDNVTKSAKKKCVSPISIATIQLMWLNRDVVSEDDDDTEHPASSLTFRCDVLPPLRITEAQIAILSIDERAAMTFVVQQCDDIQAITTATTI